MSKVKVNIVDLSKQSKVKIKPIKRANHIHFSDHQILNLIFLLKMYHKKEVSEELALTHLFSSCRKQSRKSAFRIQIHGLRQIFPNK